jgi:hypothetical protein
MKAIFWTRQEVGHLDKSDWRETNLARAIQAGAKIHGDEVEIRAVPDDGQPTIIDCDLVLKIGVKSRNWFRAYNKAGIPYCYFDKGYIRTRAMVWLEYWRLSVNGHQPLAYVKQAKHDSERANKLGLSFNPWRTGGDAILVDGSSGKHHYFHADRDYSQEQMGELHEDANQIASSLVKRIRSLTKRPIIYRPKPSWKFARPIPGAEYSRGKEFKNVLARSHVVVTYGSNLCFDAALFGVPSIVLGHGIAGPISSTDLSELENPHLAPEHVRQQWLNNVAWTQFHALDEFENGMAWEVIKAMRDCTPIEAVS